MAPQSVPSKKNVQKQTVDTSTDGSFKLGRALASPAPGEEVIISGISGTFPSSNNVQEFSDNLFNKVDMVTPTKRWPPGNKMIPKRTGQLKDIVKFDNAFFGISYNTANIMDPMIRIFLEKATEAILDAGVNPKDLEGTNTGVFVGSCHSESEAIYLTTIGMGQYDELDISRFTRSVIPHRVSYHFKLKGPSFTTDTACSSSFYAFEQAYRAIRLGICDAAIVGAANLCLHPNVSSQFNSLGVLSDDGACRAFDQAGKGYARSEAICAMFLQKSKNSKRIYAQVVHAKTNCDGYKETGITFPSGRMQGILLKECYEECQINPSEISFVEAHGTGTLVGDPEEATAIASVFCQNRKSPLLMGSLKSNIGHTEPSSGLCSLIKCIIAMESGYIPPNIHYTLPRPNIKPLVEGKINIVTEKTPFPEGKVVMGVNCFGFGGSNGHVVVTNNKKEKIKGQSNDATPKLVCISGRVENSISALLDDVLDKKVDSEHIRLLQSAFSKDIVGHLYRGYSIVTKSGEILRSIKLFSGQKPPFCLIFSGYENCFQVVGNNLLSLPLFASSIQNVHNLLSTKGISIMDILTKNRTETVSNKILGSIAVQIGIADILKSLQLVPDFIFGYSLGELASAYFDGALTLEETVLSAYTIKTAVDKLNGLSTATSYMVSINNKDLQYILQLNQIVPDNTDVQAIDTENSLITTASSNGIVEFLVKLKENGIQVIELGSQITNNKHLLKNKSQLIQELSKVITKPKKWSNSEKYASAEYFVDVLLNKTLYKNLSTIKNGSLLLEIGSDQLQPIIKLAIKNKSKTSYINLLGSNDSDVCAFLKTLGCLYEKGLNPQVDRIYPEIKFPVSRGTPMISSLIKWNHSKDWYIFKRKEEKKSEAGEAIFIVHQKDKNFSFITGHVIDGRNLFPATGYLRFVWEAFAQIYQINQSLQENMKLVFQNCKFLRATNVPPEGEIHFTVMIQPISGNFEVIEGGSTVVTGRIYQVSDVTEEVVNLPIPVVNNKEPMLQSKDIYKELRLRGYNYSGMFRGIEECSLNASAGKIKWENNWVSFMDNMLQMQILQVDTRLLYVPTSIDKVIIDAESHNKYVEALEEVPLIPVFLYPDCKIIKTHAIEISGLKAASISKRKLRAEPVLEKYEFVPNVTNLTTLQSIRVHMQVALENSYSVKVKVAEIIDEATVEENEPLASIIFDVLGDQPLIQAEILVLSKNNLIVKNATVENKTLTKELDCKLIVGTNLLTRNTVLQQALKALKENGHILSREPLDFNASTTNLTDITILTVHTTETEVLVLLCKSTKPQIPIVINVSSTYENFDWLPVLQNACKSKKEVIVFSQNEPLNGVLGLVNCINREPDSQNVRCVLIMDEAPPFDPQSEFYLNQLNKNLAINIYKDGKWGTYRHLLLEQLNEVESEHCFVNTVTKGDLSSLKWLEGNLNHNTKMQDKKSLVHVYFSALNFRDVMTAIAKINVDVITMDRIKQECVQGFEFSGRDNNGRRVMGMTSHGALSTLVEADDYLLWEVPEQFSLEEAATLPVVYATCLYGLVYCGKLKKGESILIHSGTGGIGQAAINLALYYGCTVYTTVGTPDKREFLKKWFPQLKDNNIGCSRDLSFENFIMTETKGRGVDMVINSLAEEKLLASVRCLAQGGRFIEIGKFDMAQDNPLSLLLFEKGASFHGVMLDQIIYGNFVLKNIISEMFHKAVKEGSVKPLKTNKFKENEIEQAFRFMATGKHMGKVLVEVQEEESERNCLPPVKSFKAHPRYVCDDDKSYIIAGGLGGFGLELADWLVIRGAKNLILNTRTGIQTGYQASRVRTWKSYGVKVKISKTDITQKSGCKQLIHEAQELGPVHAIFNLAVVLRDAILENQDQKSFRESFGPKAYATKYLDEVTRELCPALRDFVIFSSVSCGRGNAGQTNYGMANSIMERICEERTKDGFPALAIEWGAVADVGLVAEMQEEHFEIEIGGTLQQRISNCLEVLDKFLRQKKSTIVSSIVVAEKRCGHGDAENIVEAAANILGIKDLKTIGMHTPFPELGLDSIMAVEIKQTLEREFQVFFSPQDIRSMTFARLQEIQNERDQSDTSEIKDDISRRMDLVFKLMGNEETINVPVINLNSKLENTPEKLLFFPGIEGVATEVQPLINHLNIATVGIQIGCVYEKNTIIEIAQAMVPYIMEILPKNTPFKMGGYSFGAVVALEVISILESKGYRGNLICIDGAPQAMVEVSKVYSLVTEGQFETDLICKIIGYRLSFDQITKYKEDLLKCQTLDERIAIANEINIANGNTFSAGHLKQMFTGICKRTRSLFNYKPSYSKIHSKVSLIRAKQSTIQGLADDYELSKVCDQQVKVIVVEADHASILESVEAADIINSIIELCN